MNPTDIETPKRKVPGRPANPVATNIHPSTRDLFIAQDKAKMTTKLLAKLSGYSHSSISMARNGRPISLRMLIDCAEVFGLEVRLIPKENKE